MNRLLFDTNVLVDWINRGDHEEVVLRPGSIRVLSSVVEMELRAGLRTRRDRLAVDGLTRAYAKAARIVCPTPRVFAEAGGLLSKLARQGMEARRASLVNDVLIALSARSVGATVVTRDADFQAIRAVAPFRLELITS